VFIHNCNATESLTERHPGVQFTDSGVFLNTDNHWRHTFVFDLKPTKVRSFLQKPRSCTSKNQTIHQNAICSAFQTNILDYEIQINHILREIRKQERLTKNLLRHKTSGRRTARSPFDFISDISQSLFGFAKDSDVRILTNHINHLEEIANSSAGNIFEFREQFSSYAVKMDARFGNLMTGIKYNCSLIGYIFEVHLVTPSFITSLF
ncbi:unnamed protein product, partial [Owenia fusiformis]